MPELGKRDIPKLAGAVLEPDLVFPGVRGGDIQRWGITPEYYVLIAQDPEQRAGYPEALMKADWPRTYAYLTKQRKYLVSRGSKVVSELVQRTAPWTTYGVGTYTFAPFRVTWKRMAADLVAVVLSEVETPFGPKPPIGTDTTSFLRTRSMKLTTYAGYSIQGLVGCM